MGNNFGMANWMWSKKNWPGQLAYSSNRLCIPTQFHLQRLVSCVRWDVLKSGRPQVGFKTSLHSGGLSKHWRDQVPYMWGCCFHFRSLGNAFQQEAILEIRQVMDEHNKRKRPVWNRFICFCPLNLRQSRCISNFHSSFDSLTAPSTGLENLLQ